MSKKYDDKQKESAISKELRIGEIIWKDISTNSESRRYQSEPEIEEKKERVRDDGRKQPHR